jgi:hypothetical protein
VPAAGWAVIVSNASKGRAPIILSRNLAGCWERRAGLAGILTHLEGKAPYKAMIAALTANR